MKKVVAVIFAFLILFTVAACGSTPASGSSVSAPAATVNIIEVDSADNSAAAPVPSEEPVTPASAPVEDAVQDVEEDGQNPVMNFIGPYVCEGCSIFIEADGSKNGRATVTWSQSANEMAEWTMTGVFDTETLSIRYSDCVKNIYVYGDDGIVTSSETLYKDGAGTIAFTEDLVLSWIDESEHVADGMLFAYMGGNMEQWDLS